MRQPKLYTSGCAILNPGDALMVLLERDLHLNALSSALKEAENEGRIVLVHGEAGIGKTSLVEHFLHEHKTKWRILQGACDSLFTPSPLGPLRDIAPQTQGRLLDLLDSESNRTAIFSACLNELQTRKSILAIEDIHWADEATLDLLKYLGRRIRQTTSLIILTYRDDEMGASHPLRILLGDLASSHALHRIPVSALTNEAVRELAKNKKVDPLELHRLTNGNPFYVTEVLAVESGIPETVRDAVLARAARLSAAARGVLEAAAVIGSRVEPWLLSTIIGAESAHIEECVSKGMLLSQGDYYSFRHELARQTILEAISRQRKTTLHRMALDALKESSLTRETLTRLAHHAEALDDPQAALEFAPLAGWWAAGVGAHREAAALYKLALRFADTLAPADHAQILEAYMVELEFMNRFPEEIAVRRNLIELWHSTGNRLREGKNLASLAGAYLNVRQVDESEAAIQSAIAMLEELPASAELAQAYTDQCYIKMMYRDCEEALAWGGKAIEMAQQFNDFDALARTCDYMGCAAIILDYDRGMQLFDRSLAIAREKNLPFAAAGALGNLGGMLLEIYDVKRAKHHLAEGIAYAAERDDDYHMLEAQAWQALAIMYQGDWAQAAAIAEDVLDHTDTNITCAGSFFTLGRLGIRRGDSGAQTFLDAATSLSFQMDSPRLDSPRLLRAEAAWLAGDHARVIEETNKAYDTALSKKHPWVAGELAFWRWKAGEKNKPPSWIAKPFALQIAGDWRGAAKEWEERGCPYEQAMALMDGDEAAQLAALEIFERPGARAIIEILKRQMRAQGIRIPRGPRPATRENPFGITAREMEVLGLLVRGQSNNAIAKGLSLSTRTVEHHIASILQKLGVGSRSEAVALALRENLPS